MLSTVCTRGTHAPQSADPAALACLPQSCALQDFTRTKPAKNLPRELCYGPQDFRIGTYVQVYGRDFLVHDCDDFTRHWYQVGTHAADLQPGAASRALCMVLHTRLADTQQVCLDLTMVMLR